MNLPPLPQPPTDNLYKFMAIFGLVLTIIGVVVPFYVRYAEAVDRAETMARVRALDVEMATSGALSQAKQEILDQGKSEPAKSPETAQEKAILNARYTEFLTKNGKTIEELEKLFARTSYMTPAMIASGIMSMLGIFLVYRGFSLWYYRLQIYQDIMIRNQAKLSKKKPKTDETEQTPKQEPAPKL